MKKNAYEIDFFVTWLFKELLLTYKKMGAIVWEIFRFPRVFNLQSAECFVAQSLTDKVTGSTPSPDTRSLAKIANTAVVSRSGSGWQAG